MNKQLVFSLFYWLCVVLLLLCFALMGTALFEVILLHSACGAVAAGPRLAVIRCVTFRGSWEGGCLRGRVVCVPFFILKERPMMVL